MTEWLDSVGDRLEATGTKPGRILSFISVLDLTCIQGAL